MLDERRQSSTSTTTRRPRTRAPPTSLEQIANALPTKRAGHPQSVVFLTADAFGILPPIARLTRDQAMFWFLSGFTAKLAGTEIGVKEPQPTFSACFGAPFLPQPPAVYARLLGEEARRARRRRSGSSTRAGPAAVRRGRADADRARRARLLRAAISGRARRRRVPDGRAVRLRRAGRRCQGVDSTLLDPRSTWRDPEAYDRKARELAAMFRDNFAKFDADDNIVAGGPR